MFGAVEYRSTHWTTDAIGGVALGVAGAAFGILLVRGLERLPGLRDVLARVGSAPGRPARVGQPSVTVDVPAARATDAVPDGDAVTVRPPTRTR